MNPLPTPALYAICTTSFGPGNAEGHLEQCIQALLAGPPAWLVYNAHGLDDEGWGPIGAGYLEQLLERLMATPNVRLVPVGRALVEADAAAPGRRGASV